MALVLLVVPETLVITEELKVRSWPYLIALIFASNIGGTATLIGDPPNILIGSQAGLAFNDFVYHLTPVIIIVMVVQAIMIHIVWGKDLKATAESEAAVMAMKPDAQNAMIRTMVDRLAAKMQANPNDLDGWDRLARAYHVLGETAKAADADSKAAALRAKASGK